MSKDEFYEELVRASPHKIDGITVTSEHIWSPVSYRNHAGQLESGILKDWNGAGIFVVFCTTRRAALCVPNDLVWG